LAAPGKAHELVRKGDSTYGGRFVVNPSGGLESKGHPLGATGLGNVFYLVTQLRGWSGPMQVADAAPGRKDNDGGAYAMLHNLGLGTYLPSLYPAELINVAAGGSCVVGLFKRPAFFEYGSEREDGRAR